MPFEEIIGQSRVKKYLTEALKKNQLASTLLFSGDAGTGKKTLALSLAAHLMKNSEKIASGNHPDLHILSPEGKGHLISIDAVRSFSKEVFKPPFEAERKVFIIEDADRCGSAAANALLKTLEEPTLDSTIILLTQNPQDLLPTIRSRVLKLSFETLKESDILKTLLERGIPQKKAESAARAGGGSLGKAIQIAEHESFERARAHLLHLLCTPDYILFMQKAEELQKMIEEENHPYQDGQLLFSEISLFVRDLYLLQEGGAKELLFFPEMQNIERASSLPSSAKMFQLIEKLRLAYSRHMKLLSCLEAFFLHSRTLHGGT